MFGPGSSGLTVKVHSALRRRLQRQTNVPVQAEWQNRQPDRPDSDRIYQLARRERKVVAEDHEPVKGEGAVLQPGEGRVGG